MSIQVDIAFSHSFPSKRNQAATFDFLADFDDSIKPNFPGLIEFEKVGSETFRWIFEAVKYSGYEIQIKFTTRFEKLAHSQIKLYPVPTAGESELSGGWEVKGEGAEAHVAFHTKLKLELPLPFFLKSMAQPITQKEISKIFDRYIQNVAKALSS